MTGDVQHRIRNTNNSGIGTERLLSKVRILIPPPSNTTIMVMYRSNAKTEPLPLVTALIYTRRIIVSNQITTILVDFLKIFSPPP